MRVVAVIGGKGSGKTTVIQRLSQELRARGYRVGAVKEMPSAEWVDIPGKETWRYGEAGVDIVVGAAVNETAFFVKRRLTLMEIASYPLNVDFLLLEGFVDEKAIAKIIVARDSSEVRRFHDDLAIAISGPIAESREEDAVRASFPSIPILDSKAEIKELADIVERKALPLFPNLARCGECGYSSCHELAKAIIAGRTSLRRCPLLEREDVILEVDGRIIPLKTFPKLIIKRTLMGMISSLSGAERAKEIKIVIRDSVPP